MFEHQDIDAVLGKASQKGGFIHCYQAGKFAIVIVVISQYPFAIALRTKRPVDHPIQIELVDGLADGEIAHRAVDAGFNHQFGFQHLGQPEIERDMLQPLRLSQIAGAPEHHFGGNGGECLLGERLITILWALRQFV
ncbi:hypothetical protein D3C84_563010 [compost metagenome]